MELDINVRKLAAQAISGCIMTLSASLGYSGAMGPASIASPGKIYIGAFGGAGAMTSGDIGQYGTAFILDVNGPLAVNAFGTSESSSMGVVGGHIGFAGPSNLGVHLAVTPAIELEGYYMGGAEIEGHDINNETTRLPEHDFLVKYPLRTGVFLVNAVLNANNTMFGKIKPYVGVGIGSAVVSIHGASAIQLSPPEPGLNHYNSDSDDTSVTFAAQPKIGFHYDLGSSTSIFAEYRFLYLSETNYVFGSTVAAGHVATAPWQVKIKPQCYNMGTIGIDFDV